MARGGKRTPRNPAPVALPAHQSERTDGGPPKLSEAGGRPYGERQALEAQEAGVAGTPASQLPAGPVSGGSVQQAAPLDAFRPSDRPTESVLSGAIGTGGSPQLSADEVLRILYRIRPSPWLARMITDGP